MNRLKQLSSSIYCNNVVKLYDLVTKILTYTAVRDIKIHEAFFYGKEEKDANDIYEISHRRSQKRSSADLYQSGSVAKFKNQIQGL